MKAFGATGDQITAAIEREKRLAPDDDFVVDHDNWDAYEIFARMWTQWKRNDWNGRLIGIDYTSMISAISLFHPDNAGEIFDQVRLIEHGYLSEANKQHG
jgi:hypothetical protein